MMYSDKLVLAVRAGGKILREHKDSVYVPFGAEYSLLIRNKNTVRALASVEIDGVSVTGGVQLIVPPNSDLDLERFIVGGNYECGNKFKFIERTQKIEDGPRGIGAEDGLITVQFEFERPPVHQVLTCSSPQYPKYTVLRGLDQMTHGQIYGSPPGGVCNVYSTSLAQSPQMPIPSALQVTSLNDIGITVPGSESTQKFTHGAWFPTDGVQHVMVIKLLGHIDGQAVKTPKTVKDKPKCYTCGSTNSCTAKFCAECGCWVAPAQWNK